MSLFTADRALLCPQFETYRLRSADSPAPAYPLPSPATQARGTPGALSFAETRSRISWDHVRARGRRGVYVDAAYGVVAFEIGDDLAPTFARVAEVKPGREAYPCVAALDDEHWAVTSDAELLVLRLGPALEAETTTYDLGEPVVLHAGCVVGGRAKLLVTRSVRAGKPARTVFDLAEVDVGLGGGGGDVDVAWALRGGDVPLHARWTGQGWMVLAGEPMLPHIEEASAAPADIAESSAGPSAGPSRGADTDDAAADADDPAAAAPYSWTQDGDTLSLTIPAAGPIALTSTTLTSSLGTRELWAEVDPARSTWTTAGAVEITLAKTDGMRWPSVFADDDDVGETLTPQLLAAVRDSFQVHTRDEPASHPAIPALLREEMDLDDDDEGGAGRDIVVGFWAGGGSEPAWSHTVSVLSLPLGAGADALVVRAGVDGLHFTPPANPATEQWTHTATSPALAFVLASKRDVRAVRHLDGRVVAIEAGAAVGTGNAYIYYPPQGLEAAQDVRAVCGAERGGLLGVAAVEVGGRHAVVALCEETLVVMEV